MKLKHWLSVMLLACAAVAGVSQAQTERELVAGRDYDLIQPAQPTANRVMQAMLSMQKIDCAADFLVRRQHRAFIQERHTEQAKHMADEIIDAGGNRAVRPA